MKCFIIFLQWNVSYHSNWFNRIIYSPFSKESHQSLERVITSGYWHLGKTHFKEGFKYNGIAEINGNFSQNLNSQKKVTDKILFSSLFKWTNSAKIHYDRFFAFIKKIQQFRNSLSLEFIFCSCPTIIILLIVGPSLFLLYALDETVDPSFSFKALGSQWFWSVEVENLLPQEIDIPSPQSENESSPFASLPRDFDDYCFTKAGCSLDHYSILIALMIWIVL